MNRKTIELAFSIGCNWCFKEFDLNNEGFMSFKQVV